MDKCIIDVKWLNDIYEVFRGDGYWYFKTWSLSSYVFYSELIILEKILNMIFNSLKYKIQIYISKTNHIFKFQIVSKYSCTLTGNW